MINGLRQHGLLNADEFDRLLATEPEFVLKSTSLPYFWRRENARDELARLLAQDYMLSGEFGRLQVYRRKDR